MHAGFTKVLRALLLCGALIAVGSAAMYAGKLKRAAGHTTDLKPAAAAATTEATPRVQRVGSDALFVPAPIMKEMGLEIAPVIRAQHAIRLPSFQGVLALDNDRLSRIHS